MTKHGVNNMPRTTGVNLARLIWAIRCPATEDTTYCFLNDHLLSSAELTGGILAATAPSLMAFFRRFITILRDDCEQEQAKPGSGEEAMVTIGAVSVRPQRRGRSKYNEGSLLRTNHDDDNADSELGGENSDGQVVAVDHHGPD